MLGVFSHLPPSTASDKDCSRCKSRRIQCDRSLPKCRKCISRNYDCPGYGPVFKWVQGVASRGKLSGQALPVPRKNENEEEERRECRTPHHYQLQNAELTGSEIYIQPESPAEALLSHLLAHFDQHVATRLAWVDGPDNPWRNLVIQLTHSSPVVLNSVLAMASEDLILRYEAGHRLRRLQAASLDYKSKTLSLLGQQLDMLPRNGSGSPGHTHQVRCILAAILLLYNVELLTAEDARWRVHIQGARAVIQWMSQAVARRNVEDQVDVFLLYEYYYSSVFMGLTTFDPSEETSKTIQTHDTLTVFSDFVQVMQTVTRAEREKHAGNPDAILPTLEDMMEEIDAAKSRTLLLSQRIQFRSADAQRDFDHLSSMYYHACLIYSHRVLGDSSAEEPCILLSRDAVLDHVSCLTHSASFAQDLVWPLFIAGTECRGCPAKQATVERAMLAVMQISGRLDRDRVLAFLKTYWETKLSPDVTWIQFARSRASDCRFLII
ncbi:Zn(II)2Cys6 transcription factor [Aspergillus brunneoviolaceus CBS 621.78]|uniref:Uncharacterized protein n=1 Tax=Aspergillus brunneoviolaceus CBS 621.78 TaxID=1450534 RepID=A0ACD1FUG1_9EURO|nr:hypothetical protein BO95DRAFT_424482 [Aspergillus brunneoviolaceus CBS 621.78]RAH40576.1 hypothetical protein BO95DRAFT_424482 [Aspergillus brunneoviolaceus CBS 621.78]